jgi:hypothetical protein
MSICLNLINYVQILDHQNSIALYVARLLSRLCIIAYIMHLACIIYNVIVKINYNIMAMIHYHILLQVWQPLLPDDLRRSIVSAVVFI